MRFDIFILLQAGIVGSELSNEMDNQATDDDLSTDSTTTFDAVNDATSATIINPPTSSSVVSGTSMASDTNPFILNTNLLNESQKSQLEEIINSVNTTANNTQGTSANYVVITTDSTPTCAGESKEGDSKTKQPVTKPMGSGFMGLNRSSSTSGPAAQMKLFRK